jgi:hypothetical protein
MPGEVALKCPGCGIQMLEQPIDTEPKEAVLCERCQRPSTYAELFELADSLLAGEVDKSLARVRRVKQRFPDR